MLMEVSSELARYLCFGKCFLDKRWPVSIEKLPFGENPNIRGQVMDKCVSG